MKKTILIFLFTLVGTVCVSAQSESKLKTEKSLEQYFEKLDLSSIQKEQFNDIVEKYALLREPFDTQESSSSKGSNSEYNMLIKSEVSEIYRVLSREQFKHYKKLREYIEPNKKIRQN